MMRITGVLLAFLLLYGCSPTPSDESNGEHRDLFGSFEELQANRFHLEREVVYHDSLFIDNLPAIAVDSDMNLYMAGERHHSAKVFRFSPEGVLEDSLGAYGTDTGEFLSIGNIEVRGEWLLVFDDRLSRVTPFSLDGFEPSDPIQFKLPEGDRYREEGAFRIRPIASLDEDGFLVEVKDIRNPAYFNDRKSIYFRYGGNGEPKTGPLFSVRAPEYLIGDHAGRPAPFQLPYPEQSLVAGTDQGHIYSAWTEEFEIVQRNRAGEVTEVFVMPYERVEMDSQRMIDYDFGHNRQLQLTRGSAEYPEYWPALNRLFVDSRERVWVSTIAADEGRFDWWVFQAGSGEVSAEAHFTWPKDRRPAAMQDNYLYTIERDDTGFGMAVRYRMVPQGEVIDGS
jgi:hypothetical protein